MGMRRWPVPAPSDPPGGLAHWRVDSTIVTAARLIFATRDALGSRPSAPAGGWPMVARRLRMRSAWRIECARARPGTGGEHDEDAALFAQLIHDLRNPLGVIAYFAEALPEAGEAEKQDFAERLQLNAQARASGGRGVRPARRAARTAGPCRTTPSGTVASCSAS